MVVAEEVAIVVVAAAGDEGKVQHNEILMGFFGKNAIFHEMLQKPFQTQRSPETLVERMIRELNDRLNGNSERDLDAVLRDHTDSDKSQSCDDDDFSVDKCWEAMKDYGGGPLYACCGGKSAVNEAVRIFGKLKRELPELPLRHFQHRARSKQQRQVQPV